MSRSFLFPSDVAGLPPGTKDLVWFACANMNRSYKPVLLRILLRHAQYTDRVPAVRVSREFFAFYYDRAKRGLPVERVGCRFVYESRLDADSARETVYDMPFRVFRAAGYVQRHQGVWLLTSQFPRSEIIGELVEQVDSVLLKAIDRYFDWAVQSNVVTYAAIEENNHGRFLVFELPDADWNDEVPKLWTFSEPTE